MRSRAGGFGDSTGRTRLLRLVATTSARCGFRRTKEPLMSNQMLERNVNEELLWDPKVDSEEIAVAADDGTVTLRGTVGSFRQKREARKAAERVFGVVSVDNQPDVRILNEHRREEADLRGDVLRALKLDSLVPTTVDVTVKDGFVTLTGTAYWQYEREEAEFIAGNVIGV